MRSHTGFMKLPMKLPPKLRLLGESEQSTAPSTPAFHERILKEACVKVSRWKPFPFKRRRVLVLTERVLRWDAAPRKEVACIDLSGVSDVRPSTSKKPHLAFEVFSRLLRSPATFVAESREQRDEWIDAIRHAVSVVHERARSERVETRTQARRPEREEETAEHVQVHVRVRQVTCRTATGEEVLWRHRHHHHRDQDNQSGGPIDLGQRRRSDAVLVWLGEQRHVYLTGDAIAQALSDETAIQATLSDGSGTVRVHFEQKDAPASQFVRKDTLALCAAVLPALLFLPEWTAVVLLALAVFTLLHKREEARQALGRLDMLLEAFEVVTETSAETETSINPSGVPTLTGTDPWACDDATGAPALFVSGCVGNVVEAREKWRKAREWRRRFEIHKVLDRPHPLWAKIGSCYTDCFLSNARNGDAVYLGLLGHIRPRSLANSGFKVEDLMHHMIFCAEFSLRHLRADPTQHLQIFVYDLDEITLSNLDSLGLLCVRDLCTKWHQCYNGHERCAVLINAPAVFPILWSLTKHFVNQTKRCNVHIAGKGRDTYNLLARFLHHKDIPSEYGGGLVLPRGLKADRHLLPNQARFTELVQSLERAHPDCKEHMPVV